MFAKILVLLHLHSKVASYIIHPSKMTRQDIDASETCCRPMTATNPTIILTHSCKIHKIMACLLVFLKQNKELGQARMTEAKCEAVHHERFKSLALSIFPLTCIPPCPNSVAYSKQADDHVSLIVNSCTCLCIVHYVGTMSSMTASTAPCMH
jgi:hypothetical protein